MSTATDTDLATAAIERGISHHRLQELEQAIASYRTALLYAPNSAQALCNLGIALAGLLRNEEALAAFEQAQAIAPDAPLVHLNKAQLLLKLGRWQEGWEEYEWRWRLPRRQRARVAPPLTQLPVGARTLILFSELGLGDTIQMLRFLPLVVDTVDRAGGGRVLLACQQPLRRLLSNLPGIEILQEDDPLPHIDFELPLSSLPRLFATRPDTVPPQPSGLFIPRESAAAARVRALERPRIGIVWAGNPQMLNDATRSMPLSNLGALAQRGKGSLISLQKGEAERQLDAVAFAEHVVPLGPLLHDMADTAAAICELDLVISVCTGVAHLAATLNMPTWLMLAYASEWRWLLGRTDTPWYPTMRIFRQDRRGDWAGVIAKIVEALGRQEARTRPPPQHIAQVHERPPTQDVTSQLQRAQQLRDGGQIDEAEVVLRAVLQTNPQHVDALVAMARIARGRGDRAASLALFQAAAAAAPQRPSMKLQAASDLRELGRLEEAEAVLRAVLADQPRHVEALVALGLLKLACFELDEAERLLSRAVAAAPNDAGALVAFGRLARRRGNRAQALARFERARRVNPRHAGALLESAAELREAGRYDEARDAVQRALDLGGDDTRASIQMAYLHRRQADHARALELLRAAHKRHPQDAAIHVDMAIELRALGDPTAAEALLNAALALEPNHPGALDQLATHYLLNEDFERSLAWSQQAIAAHPRRLAPYLRAGRALSELGRSDEALDLLEEARRLIGAHPEIRAAQVAVHMLDQNWAAARALLSAPEADTKRHVQLWSQHAALLLAIGDYDGAEAALPDAQLANLQDNVRLKLFRGKIAEARWRLDDAVGFYREALALDPNDGWTHAELARVSLKVLDIDAGELHQRRMLELRSSSYLLRGKSLNVSQSMIGQLLDEFAIDRLLLDALRRIRTLDPQWQLDHLRRQVARNPGHTPSAIMLLIALRESGRLVQASAPASGTLARIPQRIFQYWDQPEPPAEIVELMDSWKTQHPDFAYIRFDDAGARQFLSVHGLADALQAYRDAREPAQRADIFRLACLAIYGGVYADADDRCLAHVASFVPADAEFVTYQEHFGTIGNNFLAVTPGHPVIRLALREACDALKRGDSDVLWLATGPGLLTRAFAQVLSRGSWPSIRDLGAVIFDMGVIARHIGFHYPVRYKNTERHWSRSSFRRVRRARAPTLDLGDEMSAAEPRA